ncbi:L-dopachrome tautomerase-related protein [Pedobacter hiemivivus]|uniref:Gluconolactonase n=1 Tax=Pedobacter hiemivivus TaxID=2530454 RepID=A0A4V2MKV8_9SPHI|nr:L-dopachrome tautomerase-related protein [Pedobacter hiemivivus]TCC99646.1 gluconolactonase [Pedobacter hiemivivus]
MKKLSIAMLATLGLFQALTPNTFAQSKAKLEIVSTFPTERPGNVAVSPQSRVFVTMSALGETKYMVKEILPNGTAVNFPDTSWIMKPQGQSFKGINSTIGIQVSSDNILWVLDMGNKKSNPKQAPKLVGWDIKTKTLAHVYPLPDAVLRPTSFLQDFAIDEKNHKAVIADMSIDGLILPAVPAFVVIDLKTGYSRRILENHASFQPLGEAAVVNGRPVSHTYPDGTVYEPKYPLNPISIDNEMKWIYYGAMGAHTIYRIPAAAVANENLSEAALAAQIENYGKKPKTDGFKVGSKGEVYVTDIEHNAVGVVTPKGYTILAQDKDLLSWPDGVALSPDGYLYIVANQLHNTGWLNNNKDVSNPPYYVLRIKIK